MDEDPRHTGLANVLSHGGPTDSTCPA